jgi:glycerol-3-phosphate O-acyltransferase
MKQTAVEWLIAQVNTAKWKFADKKDREAIIQQAKEMEKEQIKNAYYTGGDDVEDNRDREAEQYYNETFKSE